MSRAAWMVNLALKSQDDLPPKSAVASKSEKHAEKGAKRRQRRKHRCTFCDLDVGNFSRHLERIHSDEVAVQKILQLPKYSKCRKEAINILRKEGDFCTSSIVPVSVVQELPKSEYICCKFCRGYYARKTLRRHVKRCFFNPDPKESIRAQIEGQTIMSGHCGPNDVLRVSGILGMLRADKVSCVAKKDSVICEVARRYIRSHKKKHLVVVANRYMRRLSRLLLKVREIKENTELELIDILTPIYFEDLVTATRNMAEYDSKTKTFKSPSLALQMGTLIKYAIDTVYSLEVRKPNSCADLLTKLNSLTSLIERNWALEVSGAAEQNLNLNRFNKPALQPAAKDILVKET